MPGWVYSGPIGAVITLLLTGLENASPLPHASSLCGLCKEVCPVDIDLPRMLPDLRHDLDETGHTPPVWLRHARFGLVAGSPRLFGWPSAPPDWRAFRRRLPLPSAERLDECPRPARHPAQIVPPVVGRAPESEENAMTSRESILNKLRAARQPFADLPSAGDMIPVVPAGDASPAALRARFTEAAEKLGCTVTHCADPAAAIAHIRPDRERLTS